MNRRGFLATILTLSAAPAIVRASSLMPIRPIGRDVFTVAGITDATTGELARFSVLGETLDAYMRRTALVDIWRDLTLVRYDISDGASQFHVSTAWTPMQWEGRDESPMRQVLRDHVNRFRAIGQFGDPVKLPPIHGVFAQ